MFEGKVAVVTGGGRGIGRATAMVLARHGASVVVNDLGGGPQGGGGDSAVAQSVADEITSAGGKAVSSGANVSGMAGGAALIGQAIDTYGRLDILVNCAGIIRPKTILEMDESDWDLVVNVNLKGYFATVKAAAPHLIKQGGTIVNFSSASGFGHWGMSSYAAAKEGVTGFTRTIARELGEYGVTANCIRPLSQGSNMGIPEVFETITYSMNKLGIPPISDQWLSTGGVEGRPENVAGAVAWLCTEPAKVVSGREIFVGGGMIAVVQEPQLTRTRAHPEGWSFERLIEPETTTALTWGLTNHYTGHK